MKNLFYFFLFLFLPFAGIADSKGLDQTDEQIISHIYNGERQEADSLLNLQIGLSPDNPKFYLLKCQNYFYSRYFNPAGLGGDSLMQLVRQAAEKAIEIGESEQMTIDQKYYVGSAYGYLARYLGRQGDYWDAYQAASTARDYLEEVLEQDPSYSDARQEMAIQTYFAGTRNFFIQFLAWLLDIGSDRTEALRQFHDVAENGQLSRTEARFVTFALYRFIENDPEQARIIGTQFLENYPQNQFVANQLSQLEFLALVESRGVDFLETEFDSLRTKYAVTNPNILNLLGYNYLNRERFDEAIRILKTNVRLYPDLANSYDSLSEAYELSGNAELAIKNAKICLEKLPFDSTITTDFRELVKESSENRLRNLGVDPDGLNI